MTSLLDDVNELLKLKRGGDLGRLEHIKKTLEAGNVLYISDTKYHHRKSRLLKKSICPRFRYKMKKTVF